MSIVTTDLSQSIESKLLDWSFIDKVVYINLDHRTDRNEHMKRMTHTFGSDRVLRFPAIQHQSGHIGCLMSHISTLNMAITNRWKNVLVLEDDAEWNNIEEGYKTCKKLASTDYDVIMLGWNYGSLTSKETNVVFNPSTKRIYRSISSTGYIVNQTYLIKLYSHLNKGLQHFLNGGHSNFFSIDRYWNSLQNIDKWFAISPCLVYQIPSYSDTENTNSNCIELLNIYPKWNFIDKVICINNKNTYTTTESVSCAFEKEKFEVVSVNQGNRFYCHINAIQNAIDKGYKTVLIIEDNTQWTNKFEQLYFELKDKIENTDFNMISLSYDNDNRLLGYIVHNRYFTTLIGMLKYMTSNYIRECVYLSDAMIDGIQSVSIKKHYYIFKHKATTRF